MRAAYKSKDKEMLRIKKEIDKEFTRRYIEFQNKIQKDIAVQLIAAVLYTLNVCEGYGKARIRRIFSEINGTFEDMNGAGYAGKFDTDDLVQLCKEKFSIDLCEEITVEKCKEKRNVNESNGPAEVPQEH